MPALTTPRYRLETYPASNGATGLLHRLTDEQAGLRAVVAPFAGAEIASLQMRRDSAWIELLDRAEDFTPCPRWRGRAPWLWPAVGRSYAPDKLEHALRKGEPLGELEWQWGGRTFPMPIHGFVMNREWRLVDARVSGDGALVECALTDDDATRQFYPFGFVLRSTCRVFDGLLQASVHVEAAKGNTAPMPFCLGNHISLRLPLSPGAEWGAVRVFAPVRRVYEPTPLGLVGAASELGLREGIELADPRLHNLIVGHFAPDQAVVRVVDPGGIEIEIGQREAALDAPRAPSDAFYFVFYALPAQGMFCPEPWLGLPNTLNTGRGVTRLPPGASFHWEMHVRAQAGG
jgi:galactose mutarotase-like enzyme